MGVSLPTRLAHDLGRIAHRALRAADENDGRARFGEFEGDTLPDAGAAPGDQGDLVVKIHRSCSILLGRPSDIISLMTLRGDVCANAPRSAVRSASVVDSAHIHPPRGRVPIRPLRSHSASCV